MRRSFSKHALIVRLVYFKLLIFQTALCIANMVHSRFWRVLVGGVYQLKHKLRRFLSSWSQNQTKATLRSLFYVKSLHQGSRLMASAAIESDVKTKREKIGRENLLQRNRWVVVQGNLNYGLLLFVLFFFYQTLCTSMQNVM